METNRLYKSGLDDARSLYEALEKASIRYHSANFYVDKLQDALGADIALLTIRSRRRYPRSTCPPDANNARRR